ncbi:MAG: TIGR03936 family radical SAM-associated protein [Flavonifractor plautii]
MPKHRLAFSKADTAKFISHLDLMRTFQRSFLRAGIAIKHTEGFNPHAFVSIPLPLSVGFSSGCEVLECQVLDTPLDQVPAKMNAALPAGITIQRCYEAVRPVKELCYVNYIVTLGMRRGPFGAESAIRDLLARDCLVMTKRSKKAKSGFTEVDLIPLIARATRGGAAGHHRPGPGAPGPESRPQPGAGGGGHPGALPRCRPRLRHLPPPRGAGRPVSDLGIRDNEQSPRDIKSCGLCSLQAGSLTRSTRTMTQRLLQA